MDDGISSEQKVDAQVLLDIMHSYDFVFTMHLMKNILGITNDLSLTLQKKDQDIENALNLVKISKKRLEDMRCNDKKWASLFEEVSLFCSLN